MNRVLKRLLVAATNTQLFERFVAVLEQLDSREANLVRVLTYHRVNEPSAVPGSYTRIMVPPQVFERQMSYVASRYHVISVADLLEHYRTGAPLPPRSLLITFDDAYQDFAEHAWPVLKRFRLPATLFVPTAYPDRPERVFWWDRLYQALWLTKCEEALDTPVGRLSLRTVAQRERAFSLLRDYVKTLPHEAATIWVEQFCRQLGAPPPAPSVLGWQALRELAQEGVSMGAHTRSHPLMTRINADAMRDEAVGSLDDLERELGAAMPIFAYPSGGFSDEAMRVLDEAGFVVAFTTGRGINDLKANNRLCLRRINVGQNMSPAGLRVNLLTWSRYLS